MNWCLFDPSYPPTAPLSARTLTQTVLAALAAVNWTAVAFCVVFIEALWTGGQAGVIQQQKWPLAAQTAGGTFLAGSTFWGTWVANLTLWKPSMKEANSDFNGGTEDGLCTS